MKKERFLGQLEYALSFMKEDEREATLNFYSEMIDDRAEDGVGEEEAVAQMESPATIAARLKGLQDQPSNAEGNKDGTIAIEFEVNDADATAPDAEGVIERKAEAFADKMDDFGESLDKTLDNLGNQIEKLTQDITLNIGNKVSKTVNAAEKEAEKVHAAAASAAETAAKAKASYGWEKKTFVRPASDVSRISVKSADLPMKLTSTQDDNIVITYFTSETETYTCAVSDGELVLTRPDFSLKNAVVGHFSDIVNSLAQMFSGEGLSFRNGAYIDLSIPESFKGDISLVGSNARIRLDNVTLHAGIQARTSNGKIIIDDVNLDSLDISTSNSKIVANDIRTRENIRFKSSNGRIELKDVIAFGKLSVETSNGSIVVNDISSDDVYLRTSNGSISGDLKGNMNDYTIQSSTSNGSNNLPNSTGGEKSLVVKSSNGSINLHFE